MMANILHSSSSYPRYLLYDFAVSLTKKPESICPVPNSEFSHVTHLGQWDVKICDA